MEVGVFLAIGIVGMVGCVVLIVVGLMWKPADKTGKPKAAPAAAAPSKTAAASPAPAVAAPVVESGAREVLRVWRETESEELLVELGGRRFAKLADIQQPAMREGLLTTLRDLEAFAAGAATVRPVVMSTPTAAPEPGVTLTNVGAVKQGTGGLPPLVAPSMNPFKQMLVLRDLNKVELPPVKSITEQIDEVLQEMLAGTPHSERDIRMHTGPKGQALFSADGQAYEALDSVPDEEVRRLIRAAAAAWESKQ